MGHHRIKGITPSHGGEGVPILEENVDQGAGAEQTEQDSTAGVCAQTLDISASHRSLYVTEASVTELTARLMTVRTKGSHIHTKLRSLKKC